MEALEFIEQHCGVLNCMVKVHHEYRRLGGSREQGSLMGGRPASAIFL